MKELFGVKIQLIEPDYNNKLYRINEETPFVPKEMKEEMKEKVKDSANKAEDKTEKDAKEAAKK